MAIGVDLPGLEGVDCCGGPEIMVQGIQHWLEVFALPAERAWRHTWELSAEALMAVHWLTDMGLLEHGATMHCSWLTEEGREVLKALRAGWRPKVDAEGDN